MYLEGLDLILEKYIDSSATLKKALDEINACHRKNCEEWIYKSAFDNGPVSYAITDYDFQIIEVNEHAKYLLQYEEGLSIHDYVHEESQDLFVHYAQKVIRSSFSLPTHIYFIIDGEKKYVKLITKKLDDYHLHCAIIDESFEKEAMYELEVIGFKDYLTGLYNRRFFHEEMTRLDVERNYPIGLIMVDVNGLKLINDAFGHFSGDQLIRETASVLLDSCRKDDIVARIGGDEFAIILPKTEKSEVALFLDRIKDEVDRRQVGDIQLSIACGSSIKTSAKDDFDHVFKRAEDVMYKDKLLNASSQRVDIINGILASLHEKHERELEHSKNVSNYMVKFGQAMCFEGVRLKNVESAGLLHDIGKIAIDYDVLELTRSLTEVEMEMVKKHAEIGYRILKSTVTFGDISEIILYHHENINGTGYPKGLKGSDIPLEARMLSICDAYDAMTSHCFYKDRLSKEDAIYELEKCSGIQFDKLLIEIFIDKVI